MALALDGSHHNLNASSENDEPAISRRRRRRIMIKYFLAIEIELTAIKDIILYLLVNITQEVNC